MNFDLATRKMLTSFANKIVFASEAYVGLKSTLNDMSSQLISFLSDPAGPRDACLLSLARTLRPETAQGLSLARIGGEGDGGYVMHDGFTSGTAISVGVGRDDSWDRDMASHGFDVHSFDHTVSRLPSRSKSVTFHRIGLGTGPRCQPLEKLIELTRPGNHVILKVDIEGSEWSALTTGNLACFDQIVIEFHDIELALSKSDRVALLAGIHETHAPVHVHANNYGSMFRADSYWFPSTLEVTYVRRGVLEDWRPAKTLREDLDRPCDPRVSEITLRGILQI